MILLNGSDFGGHSTHTESWDTLYDTYLKKVHQNGDPSLPTNVNFINTVREIEVVISTDSPADMPSATASGSHIPSNEECGIRDVWAHNLEEEFRAIRQVS